MEKEEMILGNEELKTLGIAMSGLLQTAESLIFLFLGFLSANNHTKKHS